MYSYITGISCRISRNQPPQRSMFVPNEPLHNKRIRQLLATAHRRHPPSTVTLSHPANKPEPRRPGCRRGTRITYPNKPGSGLSAIIANGRLRPAGGRSTGPRGSLAPSAQTALLPALYPGRERGRDRQMLSDTRPTRTVCSRGRTGR